MSRYAKIYFLYVFYFRGLENGTGTQKMSKHLQSLTFEQNLISPPNFKKVVTIKMLLFSVRIFHVEFFLYKRKFFVTKMPQISPVVKVKNPKLNVRNQNS